MMGRMQIVQVHIHIKPEHADAFRAATVENARNSVQEPGIARFDFLEHADDPSRFELLEVYKNEEAIAAHKLTPHYKKWLETVENMFAETRTRSWFKNVFPVDENW
jgi:quinol monooxygenase YgiN